jgi:hypothetical protein
MCQLGVAPVMVASGPRSKRGTPVFAAVKSSDLESASIVKITRSC